MSDEGDALLTKAIKASSMAQPVVRGQLFGRLVGSRPSPEDLAAAATLHSPGPRLLHLDDHWAVGSGTQLQLPVTLRDRREMDSKCSHRDLARCSPRVQAHGDSRHDSIMSYETCWLPSRLQAAHKSQSQDDPVPYLMSGAKMESQ